MLLKGDVSKDVHVVKVGFLPRVEVSWLKGIFLRLEVPLLGDFFLDTSNIIMV